VLAAAPKAGYRDLIAEPFLNTQRLLRGPWQAFERDVARLLVCNGFDDVRLIGGSGDAGADVLGVKGGELWVIQCKFTTNGYPAPTAVDQVGEAARYYKADRIYVATSRQAGPGMAVAVRRWAALGVEIGILEPATLLGMARKSPEYPPSRRDLRDYQNEAVDKFTGSLRETGRAQVVLATGLGKTVVLAESIAQLFRDEAIPGGKALVLAGTRELVDQLQRAFWDQLPKWIPTHRLIGGEYPSDWAGITFATVQSAVSRLDDLPSFGTVLIDEAHHVGSDTFRRVTDRMADAMIGGVTATPWRGDGYDIDQLLGPPVVRIGIAEGLRRGFLCEADYRLLADNIDWKLVSAQSRNRYSINQLNKLLLLPTRDEEAARAIREAFDVEHRRSAIIFCSSVAHAKSFAAMLRLFGFRAEPITGDMTPRERDTTMAAFRKGALDVVTTRDLFNEGVDVPDVDMIVFMRVTHSRRIFVQQLGRGLRISPRKKKVVVLDFVSDLRRLAEVVELERAVRGDVERLRLPGVIQFRDEGAGTFMLDWMKDQADLFTREGDPTLELPAFDFPAPRGGSVQ
jgi:superfamily II DNA or RNA helicase